MADTGDKYVCEICGQEIQVIKGGGGELACCGQPMTKQD